MKSMKYDSKQVVGDFFEEKTMKLFDLVKTNDTKLPDLVSKKYNYYVEVKASYEGTVIKERQLNKQLKNIEKKRFFALWFHDIKKIKGNYKKEIQLIEALKNSKTDMYLMPISIIEAHYKNNKTEFYKTKGNFTRLRKTHIENTFNYDLKFWETLDLKLTDYQRIQIHNNIQIITKKGDLEEKILKSFHPEYL